MLEDLWFWDAFRGTEMKHFVKMGSASQMFFAKLW